MTIRHDRTLARRVALQVLYSAEMTDAEAVSIIESGVVIDEVEQVDDYARRLISGVEEERAQIDEFLDSASDNWAIGRMPIVDRIVMRIACFEMLHVDEVPVGVSINEAVELAKDFGGEDESHRFVNGVLGNIAKRMEAGEAFVAAGAGAEAPAEEPAAEEIAGPAAEEPAAADAEAPAQPGGEAQ